MKINFPSSDIVTLKHTFYTELKSNLKIVHITDLHIGYYSGLESLHQLVIKINNMQPDIICLTGDCFDDIGKIKFDPYLVIPLFITLKSKYGKFFVPGNHDYGSNSISTVIKIMKLSGFNVLLNETQVVKTCAGNLSIYGIDDLCFGQPNFSNSFYDKDDYIDFRVCLMHEPDKVRLLNPNINLILSGHTHGGQIRLPVFGALHTPALGKKYKQGLYQIRHRQYLYVNKGIGMTRLPIRVFCNPEIAIFYLKGK